MIEGVCDFPKHCHDGEDDSERKDCHGPGDAYSHVACEGKIPVEVHDGNDCCSNASDSNQCGIGPVCDKVQDACQIAESPAEDNSS